MYGINGKYDSSIRSCILTVGCNKRVGARPDELGWVKEPGPRSIGTLLGPDALNKRQQSVKRDGIVCFQVADHTEIPKIFEAVSRSFHPEVIVSLPGMHTFCAMFWKSRKTS